jgi:hypothetical protein
MRNVRDREVAGRPTGPGAWTWVRHRPTLSPRRAPSPTGAGEQ